MRRTRAKKRTPRPVKTYEVSYLVVLADSIEKLTYRLRCPELTRVQLGVDHKPLVGEVSVRHGVKWSAFSRGCLPPSDGGVMRTIREEIDPIMVVV